jgi:co-chaperonin GroES (HSP10)
MIKPYGGMLLIKEDAMADKTTASGIVLSAAFNDTGLRTGKIIDLGDGEYNYKGDLVPINGLDVGDTVYYPQHSGSDVEDEDGQKYLILNSKNVLAIKS